MGHPEQKWAIIWAVVIACTTNNITRSVQEIICLQQRPASKVHKIRMRVQKLVGTKGKFWHF